MSNDTKLTLEQVSDLFCALALAPVEERAVVRQGITEAHWQEMGLMIDLAGLKDPVALRYNKFAELMRAMIVLQDRAVETLLVGVDN
jgi:hypothetical protein